MRRRDFIRVIAGSVVARPIATRAQRAERMRRIGMLIVTTEDDPQSRNWVVAFVQGLERLGWTVGRNLQIDYRWVFTTTGGHGPPPQNC